MFEKSFHFLLFSNLFMACCAAVLAAGSFLQMGMPVHYLYVGFIFASTIVLYNFPVFFDPNFPKNDSVRHLWIAAHRKELAVLTGLAILSTAFISWKFSLEFFMAFAPAAILSIAYFFPQTRLRNEWGIKAAVVALVWTLVTWYYPAWLSGQQDLRMLLDDPEWWRGMLQRFFFILPLCIIYNVRDMRSDSQAGIITLPLRFGIPATRRICLFFLLLSGIVMDYGAGPSSGLNLAVLICTAFLIIRTRQSSSEYHYMFWLDGMMALSGMTFWL